MKLFLPHAQLESWLLDDKADIRDGRLHLLADGSSHPAVPAIHFTQLISGEDTWKLMNKVKPEASLEAIGGERMGEAVLLGETAYEVVPGYLAEVPEGGVSGTEGAGGSQSEQALLEGIFLDTL